MVARELYNQNTLEISITICYYNITKGATDRRLVLIVLVKKVTATIFRLDGGYFFSVLIYSINTTTIIDIIINTIDKISKSLIKCVLLSQISSFEDFYVIRKFSLPVGELTAYRFSGSTHSVYYHILFISVIYCLSVTICV